MNSDQARKLFQKYLDNECSDAERRLLDNFLESFQGKSNLLSELKFDEEIKGKIWAKIQKEADIKKLVPNRSNKLVSFFKYAAIIVGLGLSLYFLTDTTDNTAVTTNEALVIEDAKIILRTGSNSINTLDEEAVGQIRDAAGNLIASQEGDMVVYRKDQSVKELIYNEIEVPRGKTFKIKLSDGSMVHLNSGTVLKFPVNFIQGMERKVFLTGEAYFEVAKDADHPFLVNAENMDVKVLGTHFVVSSYKGASNHAVLLEGSVAVREPGKGDGEKETIIVPGQKASLQEGNMLVEPVNVNNYIGWMKDILIFNDESFAEIAPKIERRYNVDIQINYQSLAPVRFNGKFQEESIIDLLDTFKESAGLDYYISDNKVIIDKKSDAYDEYQKP